MSTAARQRSDAEQPVAQLAAELPGHWQLVVKFVRQGDRWTHCIDVIQNPPTTKPDRQAMSVRVAMAVNEGEESDWPPSPPLQQLDECQLSRNRRGLVGLGMAGTSHWSLAVEPEDGQLWFDVACRIQHLPECLQSCYELPQAYQRIAGAETAEDSCIVLAGQPQGLSLEIRPDPHNTELKVIGDGRRLLLRPTQLPDGLPATVRWRYGFLATA